MNILKYIFGFVIYKYKMINNINKFKIYFNIKSLYIFAKIIA